ncbi:hypothetical protein [Algoriphagus persicinus]|uniref:hypothetical protein n=1 Tax=Algoriphagus persicinus TaxID=3108754 RepID=UPI002B3A4663|nr:hypothetical protein [Algoriphagus sp. E1-3-M2]MEB2785245.1 hypothetical protein [Algoriphagus sp. E1-3-M2]
MENKETDYKKLYEETLLVLPEKQEALAEKDHVIADLGFELDKLRRYIFGFKSEKRNGSTGDNQMGLFELGVTQSVQEKRPSCSGQEAGEMAEGEPVPVQAQESDGRSH